MAEVIQLLWKSLDSIPSSFWGVLVGSMLSFLGIALTNRANDRRLKIQLEHDRDQKKVEREMILRKDVFLAVAEAISDGLNMINRNSDLDVANNEISGEYAKSSKAIAKLHVIAGTDVARSMMNFTSQMELLYLRLFGFRLELVAEKEKITQLAETFLSLKVERDRVFGLIKQMQIDGDDDEKRWNTLKSVYQLECDRIQSNCDHRIILGQALSRNHSLLISEVFEARKELTGLLIPVLAAIRYELNMPFDIDVYQGTWEKNLAVQKQALDEFVARFVPVEQPSIAAENRTD
nr:hypothetical protein [uncultured Undibacterium sp.]